MREHGDKQKEGGEVMSRLGLARTLLAKLVKENLRAGTELRSFEWAVLVQAMDGAEGMLAGDVKMCLFLEARRKNGCVVKVARGIYRARMPEDDVVKEVVVDECRVDPEQGPAPAKFEPWEGDKMACGIVTSRCYQGEQCCNGAGCRAARAAGFKTMDEVLLEGKDNVVWSWGGGMCGGRSSGQ